ncbi:ABC transporter permease [Kosmotoga pacifica]|uniref:Peptide ABC transporter permease n=1 Tax=Kosmotoga pacifica TaxID=1330330 RepID=A0A0G2Z5F0_9BACT|nr:ABC transporter permease [Kosmotoga pacifica]AKI96845.1 peptide ABC transporter permease [Kosmotoga pacifica]
MSLKWYILTRILLAIPMFFILLLLIFVVLRILPGDPVLSMLGGKAPMSVIEAKRHELGYDRPLLNQFGDYLLGVLKGDLGRSALTKRPIADEIADKLPATIELTIFGFIIALVIGIFWGAEATKRHGGILDVTGRVYAIFIYSIPVFWLGMLFQWLFGVKLKWLPIAGRISPLIKPEKITGMYIFDALFTWNLPALKDASLHIILPSVALGLIISSVFLRMVRGNMVLMLSQDFVKAARARGIKENSVIYRHALKNAFVPIMTVMGLQFAALMAGAVLTETTFSWPGIGSYLIEKIRYRDFPAIQGTIAVYAIIVVAISIIVDIMNALVDPRVRY